MKTETANENSMSENRNRVSRESYARKKIQGQIKELTGGTPFEEKSTTVWMGDPFNGRWVKVIQLTPIDWVTDIGKGSGARPKKFRGAIVALSEVKQQKYSHYRAIKRELIKEVRPCVAKWEGHTGANEYNAMMWTGIHYPSDNAQHHSQGYVFVDFVENFKCSFKKKVKRWISSTQVRETGGVTVCGSRRKINAIDRYDPGATYQKKEKTDSSYFGRGVIKPRKAPVSKACQDRIVEYYKYFNTIDKRGLGTKDTYDDLASSIDQLFYDADGWWQYMQVEQIKREWHPYNKKLAQAERAAEELREIGQCHRAETIWKEFCDNNTRPTIPPKPTSSPKSPVVELSLIYDIIRGNVIGNLGKVINECINVPLGIIAMPYVLAIQDHCIAREELLEAARKEEKSKQPRDKRRVCNVANCQTFVHQMFVKDGVCYKHGNKTRKGLCKMCHNNVQASYGNLCAPCFRTQENKGALVKDKCTVCSVRVSVYSGGRCSYCISNQALYKSVRVCKVEGCQTLATFFHRDGVCYKHGDMAKKAHFKKCHKSAHAQDSNVYMPHVEGVIKTEDGMDMGLSNVYMPHVEGEIKTEDGMDMGL